MDDFRLTPKQIEDLLHRISEALEQMIDRSCIDMAPLWIEATRQERKSLGGPEQGALGFTPSERYFRLSKGVRSRYRTLACWRLAVLLERVAEQVADPEFRDAMEVVYFTPYPANSPPYAWSSRGSDAPGVERFDGPATLKTQAKEGSYQAVLILLDRVAALHTGTYPDLVLSDLLRKGCRRTVRDVLKLEEHKELEQHVLWGEP